MFDNLKGKLFSPDSAGAFLELSRAQIHRLISSHELNALKLGTRTTRITGDSIVAYLERKANIERKPVCVKKIDTTKSNQEQKKLKPVCRKKIRAIVHPVA